MIYNLYIGTERTLDTEASNSQMVSATVPKLGKHHDAEKNMEPVRLPPKKRRGNILDVDIDLMPMPRNGICSNGTLPEVDQTPKKLLKDSTSVFERIFGRRYRNEGEIL